MCRREALSLPCVPSGRIEASQEILIEKESTWDSFLLLSSQMLLQSNASEQNFSEQNFSMQYRGECRIAEIGRSLNQEVSRDHGGSDPAVPRISGFEFQASIRASKGRKT